MAIPGDPFATTELDERRRRQRRHLRTLGRSIVDLSASDDLPVVPDGTDAAWLEEQLRELADLELVHVGELFLRSEEARAKGMVARFVRRNVQDDPDGAFESLADELTAVSARGWLDGIGRRERIAVRRYVQLALWADAVAP